MHDKPLAILLRSAIPIKLCILAMVKSNCQPG